MKPQLSIIITTWNTAKITLKCVQTITRYLPKGYAEIIIVDNGSTDNTASIIGQLKNIIYIQNNQNLGFSKANNIGAKNATTKTFLFLNSDMELIDDTLQTMHQYYTEHKIGVIGPKFLNPDLSTQGSVLPPQTPFNAFREFWLGQKAYSKYSPELSIPHEVHSISGGALMISRELFSRIGGWDERYFFYGEDLELCRQVHLAGQTVLYFPNCKLVHHHGSSGQALADTANQWRRQIPSSKIYHGLFEHYLLFLITWTAQKLHLTRRI
jgi:hypothetical protein